LKDATCCWKDVNGLFTNGLIASSKHDFTKRHSTLVMEKISKKIKKNWPILVLGAVLHFYEEPPVLVLKHKLELSQFWSDSH